MTDEEYIRKAVELADGWSGDSIPALNLKLRWDHPQQALYLDALAAQLVRQVDALGDIVSVDIRGQSGGPEVIVWDFRPGRSRIGVNHKGPDRTMNTIKAIVDSGVLTKD